MTMSMRRVTGRTVVALLVAGALVGSPAAASAVMVSTTSVVAGTAVHLVPAKKPTVKTFANCTALNKVHKGGVAKAGVKYNKVSGKNKPFKVKPTFSTALYKANSKMDRDKDGIACEKG